jgi:hypothetical protein
MVRYRLIASFPAAHTARPPSLPIGREGTGALESVSMKSNVAETVTRMLSTARCRCVDMLERYVRSRSQLNVTQLPSLFCTRRSRFRRRITIVTFPMAGT